MEYLADEENQAYLRHRARKLDESQTECQCEKEQMEADELAISVKKAKLMKSNNVNRRKQRKFLLLNLSLTWMSLQECQMLS